MSEKRVDCDYVGREDGIHEFIVHKPTRNAIDIQSDALLNILMNSDPDQPLFILTDLRESGVPPLRYATGKTKEVMQTYFAQYGDTVRLTYVAYIVSSNSLLHTFKFFLDQLARGKVRMRFFDNREDAETWLLNQTQDLQSV